MDIRKLRDYCLNPDSPKGRTKARVFSASLRLAPGDAEFLHQILLQAAANEECRPSEADDHGQRYTVDLMVATSRGEPARSQRVDRACRRRFSAPHDLLCSKVRQTQTMNMKSIRLLDTVAKHHPDALQAA